MQFSQNKAKAATITTIFLLIATVTLTVVPIQAQDLTDQEGGSTPGPIPAGVTPDLQVDTVAFLSFRPTTVGFGQTFLVNMWLNPATHASRYMKDYEVVITKPDGTKDVITMDSYRADTTAWFEYIADQTGEWTLQFNFPGGYFPAGLYTPAPGAVMGTRTYRATQSVYYKADSTPEQTLIVQDETVYSWPESPLPTDYWTRPASFENREWWPILGNYPGTGYSGVGNASWDELYPGTNPSWSSTYDFHPWVAGPNSAHIVWKRQGAIAGLTGGPAGQYGETSSPSNPSLIYAGRCYQTYTKPGLGYDSETYWRCYDLRTGEVYWEYPVESAGGGGFFFGGPTGLVPNAIAYVKDEFLEVPGAAAGSTYSAELIRIQGGRLYKWNPWTGALTTNVSVSPLSGTFHNQIEGYVLGVVSRHLINWTTVGSSSNWQARIISNTSYSRSNLPGGAIDWSSGYCAVSSAITPQGLGAWYGTTVRGYNLYTGEMIWEQTVPDTSYSSSCTVADHGKVAVLMMGGYFMAWDLRTGTLAWKGEAMDYPWSEPAFGAYAIQSAYGKIFRQAYDGVYAFNWDNGSIAWKYKAPAKSVYESPYIDETGAGVYSFNTGAMIADGKMWTYNTEHTVSWPLTRGWGLHCINITNGELVWKIGNPMSPGAVADGYLAAANSRDGYEYVFGKGKSATTVTGPDTAVPLGTEVLIKGSVLDMSPAQPSTPCVSKESMTMQMEYLHLQMPIRGLWGNETMKGVPLSIDTLDPNGNYRHIGVATTEGYSGTFGYTWEPDVPGQYAITATFMGDESYGSSMATTYLSVVEPEPTVTPQPVETPPDSIPYIIGATIAVILSVAIVGLLLLRKQQ